MERDGAVEGAKSLKFATKRLRPIERNAARGLKPSRRLFCAFMSGLLALGLPDPRQVLGVGLDLATPEMCRGTVGVQVRA